jgi:hypothetical protein
MRLSIQRPLPSITGRALRSNVPRGMLILIFACVSASIQSPLVNCDPWTPFQVSSRDLSLVYLFVAARDDVEDFACDVSFQVLNGLELCAGQCIPLSLN